MRVVIRADAGHAIGTGHILRCHTLAEHFRSTGARVAFICRPHQGHLGDWLRQRGLQVFMLDEPDVNASWLGADWQRDADETQGVLEHLVRQWGGIDWLVVDHYQIDALWQKRMRPMVEQLMVIDDLADRPHACDLLLDQTQGRSGEDYRGLVPETCQLMLGAAFALLRPQFRFYRQAALARRRLSAGRRLLVSVGGFDPDNVTGKVVNAVIGNKLELEVDVVLAAGAPHRSAIQRQMAGQSGMRLLTGVENMAELLATSDIAVGAPGSTAWERCCLGLPTIVLITANNQRRVAVSLQQAGAARLLGDAGDLDEKRLAEQILELLAENSIRSAMSVAGARICDGLGLQRVASRIDPLLSHDGRAVYLSPITMADVNIIYQWQCDPRTRRFSHNPKPPELDSHIEWMKRRIDDHSCLFNLIMHGREPAGVLRLDWMGKDPEASEAYMVSVLVAPDHYRQGLASSSLKLARQMLPGAAFHAEVLASNKGSRQLFESAGYRFDENLGHYLSTPLPYEL